MQYMFGAAVIIIGTILVKESYFSRLYMWRMKLLRLVAIVVALLLVFHYHESVPLYALAIINFVFLGLNLLFIDAVDKAMLHYYVRTYINQLPTDQYNRLDREIEDLIKENNWRRIYYYYIRFYRR